jgi:hypothetical protein
MKLASGALALSGTFFRVSHSERSARLPMKSLLRVLIVLSCVSVSVGCHDWHFKYFGIVDPSPFGAVRPFVFPFSIFRADLTVVNITTVKSCAVIFTPGQIFPGTQWRMNTGSSGSIFLQQDITNTPNIQPSFSGTLDGLNFVANSSNIGNALLPSCLFRNSTLTGKFSPDFRTFNASELLTWGSPGAETTIQRNWIGSAVVDQ